VFISILERVVSAAGLIVLSPFLLIVAAAIVLNSGFPILFRQWRIVRRGEPFTLFKFRSMVYNSSGRAITSSGDRRVTSVGAVLRKYKLDEIPQLWNVVLGDMSLVGPRPELPAFVDLKDPAWCAVLEVKPGITDLATLLFRNEEELLVGVQDVEQYYRTTLLPAKLDLNLKYLQKRSLRADLRLILLTVWFSALPRQFDADRISRLLLQKKPA
jgi:lipopolysaccharide/colanic/teichoic acid biosynthesis glycosyltransferase